MFFNKKVDSETAAKLQNELDRLRAENTSLKKQLDVQTASASDSLMGLSKASDDAMVTTGVFDNMVPFSDYIGDVQGSMLDVSEKLRDEKPKMVRAAEVSTTSRQSMSDISSALTVITEDTAATSKSVEGLSQRAEEIGGIVSLIKNISDQTNLLALNAAIEAARAGEKGRGFAVVADEVRSLAKRAGDATSEISALVESIQDETSQAKKQIETVAINAENFSEIGAQARSQMDEMIDLSNGMEEIINASALRSFVEVVKVDHLVWKLEVYKVFMGVSKKPASEFANHTMCRLGKWYYEGEGKNNFSKKPGFLLIEKPHKEVHQNGLEALNQLKAGNADVALQNLTKMEQASMGVLQALSELSEQL